MPVVALEHRPVLPMEQVELEAVERLLEMSESPEPRIPAAAAVVRIIGAIEPMVEPEVPDLLLSVGTTHKGGI